MPEPITDILIFGAGFGTRMAPLTDNMPKPLVQVAGRPLIDHALDLAEAERLSIHVNAHYRATQLQAHLGPHIRTHIEDPDILDTGGGLKNALPDMAGGAVLTLNSDAVWSGPNPLTILKQAWADHMEALLLLVPLAQTVGYSRAGNFRRGKDGMLTRSPDGQVYTGAQIIRRSTIEDRLETAFSLNLVWDDLLARGTAFGAIYPGTWADVGTPDGIGLAEDMLANV